MTSRESILRQEGPLAKAILREYPREQFLKTAHNFVAQLELFDLADFKSNPDIVLGVEGVLTGAGRYMESREAHDQLHLDAFYWVHRVAIILSLLGIGALLPWLYRRRPMPLIALGFIVVSSVVVNALFTGALSMVAGRYESRVMWLVPMFAGLCFVKWADEREMAGDLNRDETAAEFAGS